MYNKVLFILKKKNQTMKQKDFENQLTYLKNKQKHVSWFENIYHLCKILKCKERVFSYIQHNIIE